jgi:Tol biopolymer transport system component
MSWRTWITWSAMAATGLTGIYAAPGTWTTARQQLAAGSGGESNVRDSAAVSADGRFVAFVSRARLLPADTNNSRDIYVLDLETSAVTLESVTTEGELSRGDSTHPSLSSDGRYVLFESLAIRLADDPADRPPMPGLYLRDRLEHRTTRVTIGRDGQPFPCLLSSATLSADGRFVAFGTSGDPFGVLKAAGVEPHTSVYRVALDTGAATLVSVAPDGHPAAAVSYSPSISGDGRIIAFIATASLDPMQPWQPQIPKPFQMSNVYVRDAIAGTTTCVGCGVKEAGTHVRTHSPSVSADGRYVTFVSDEIKIAGNQFVLMAKIWLYDRVSSALTLVTQSPHGRAPNGNSRHPVVSAHGDVVVFESEASNLACDRRCARETRDENLLPDIYLFERVTGTIRRISGDGADDWWEPSVGPSIDGAGRMVAFSSGHPISPRDIDADFDLHVWRDEAPPHTH